MDDSLGAGRLRVPRHKIRNKTWGPQGRVVTPHPAWIAKRGAGDCSPFGDVCPVGNTVVYRNKINKLEVFDCSWKKSLGKVGLSLFKSKRKAGVGGLDPDCHWGVHEEGLPRTSPSLTRKSHQLWQQSSGSLSCREKYTNYQRKGLPWGSALGGISSV